MIHLVNIRQTRNLSEQQHDLYYTYGIVYLEDKNGLDWYESQKMFSEKTIKVMYDSDKIIRAISQNVSMLYPENMSVVELINIPDNCDTCGGWKYQEGEIVNISETQDSIIRQALLIKNNLLIQANAKILILQDAVTLGLASDQENLALIDWRKYRVWLNRVDISTAPDIEWPILPA